MKTHYEVLNLGKTCSSKEIKESFLKLSKKYHPDKNKSADAHKKFVEVNEAYSVLGKPDSRSRYDASLHRGIPNNVYRPSPGSTTTVYHTPYEFYANMYKENMRKNAETSGTYFTNRKLGAFLLCCVLVMIGSGIRVKAELVKRDRNSREIAQYLRDRKERYQKLKERKMKEKEEEMVKKELETVDLQK